MDYEQKYKEALDWARKVYPHTCGSEKEDLEHFFPELKESDDERIRKAISAAICGTTAEIVLEGNGVKLVDALAYLEKQKEQKPSLYWRKIKANDHLPCRAYIYKFAYEQENNFYGRATIYGYLVPNEPVTIGCDTWYLPVDDIKNLPKEEDLDTVSPMKTVEQKPAEWSEEDKNRFNNLCSVIDESESWNDVSKQAFKDWLKSSLRPQPHWKPSKEQMKALESLPGLLRNFKLDISARMLEVLYEQLKSLL